jgi:hypothetical protein
MWVRDHDVERSFAKEVLGRFGNDLTFIY